MNMMKKNGGFTLVELIVVIAILAILAGVAVPAYSGYISKANKTADDQAIAAIETAMSSALAMEGLNNDVAQNHFSASISNGELTVEKATNGSEAVWANFETFYNAKTCKVTLKYYTALDADDFSGSVLKTCATGDAGNTAE